MSTSSSNSPAAIDNNCSDTAADAVHSCVLCNEKFSNKSHLKEHFKKHGRGGSLSKPPNRTLYVAATCDLCDVWISSQVFYWKHYHDCHPDWRGVDCIHCGTHFHHNKEYLRHCDEKHTLEQVIARADCEHQTNHLSDSDAELSNEQSQCPVCPAKFFNRNALRHHVVIHETVWRASNDLGLEQETKNKITSVNSSTSSTWSKSSPSKSKKRRKTTTGDQLFEPITAWSKPMKFQLTATFCKACQCRFANGTALAQHLITHGFFLCMECGQEMDNDIEFRGHQQVCVHSSTSLMSMMMEATTRNNKLSN